MYYQARKWFNWKCWQLDFLETGLFVHCWCLISRSVAVAGSPCDAWLFSTGAIFFLSLRTATVITETTVCVCPLERQSQALTHISTQDTMAPPWTLTHTLTHRCTYKDIKEIYTSTGYFIYHYVTYGPRRYFHILTHTHTHISSCQRFDFHCVPDDNCPVRQKRPVNISRVETEPAGGRVLWISLSNRRLMKPTVKKDQTRCQFGLLFVREQKYVYKC